MKAPGSYVPLLKVLLPFAAGTLIAINLLNGSTQLPIAVILIGVVITFLVFSYIIRKFTLKDLQKRAFHTYHYRWTKGVILLMAGIALGISNVWLHTANLKPDFFSNALKPKDYLLGTIIIPIQDKGNSFRTIARIDAEGSVSEMHSTEGKLLIYFEKDSIKKLPEYGDQILIKNVINPIKSTGILGEFDMGKYMSNQGIYHSAFLKSSDWISTGENKGNIFWKDVYRIDNELEQNIGKALPDPDLGGIAEALIIGDESAIPNETISDYSGTGTIHILSVSGLHIGLIIFGLNGIFSFLLRFSRGKYIRLVLVLIIIWAYAFLTGFSPPIARSVIMFSIVYLGINLGRRTSIYNSIAVSAFILLLTDPFLIMQASFQLSYIALTGIVWLQPGIAAILRPKNKFTQYLWELASASIAAQIITFPLSILYFNQFSIYFLPANLIVIPASFVVLVSGIFFVFASLLPLTWLHLFATSLLYYCIHFLNLIVKFINHLPGATWQGLYISNPGVTLLYLCIILAITAILIKNKLALASGLFFAVVFLSFRELDIYNGSKKQEINILSVSPDHTMISLKDHQHLLILSDSGLINDHQLIKYHVKGYAFENYIRPGNIICLNSEISHNFSDENMMVAGPLIGFYDKRMLIINSKTYIQSLLAQKVSMDIDAVILSGNPSLRLSDLYQKFHFKRVIASSGDHITNIRQWETECIENNIPFINLQNMKFTTI